jgi:hypothetical protein
MPVHHPCPHCRPQWGYPPPPPPPRPPRTRFRLACLLAIPLLLLAGPHAHQVGRAASQAWHAGPQVHFDLPDLTPPTSTTLPPGRRR